MIFRVMTIADYEKVYRLWMSCTGMGFIRLPCWCLPKMWKAMHFGNTRALQKERISLTATKHWRRLYGLILRRGKHNENVKEGGRVLKVIIIRHGKVDFQWQKRYTSTEFDKACAEYDAAPLEERLDASFFRCRNIFISTLPRTKETAGRTKPD